MQLMTFAIPQLEDKQKNGGEAGRKELQQITRYGTVVLAIVQSLMLANLLTKIQNPAIVVTPGPLFLVSTTVVLTACAVFIMWMGEIITERGVGNGASLLIFLGIAARLPVMVKNTADAVQTGQSPLWGVLVLSAVFLVLVALIVCLQQGVRKVMVLGARRNVGRQVFAAPDDFMFLPVNPSGVMAIIFASSALMFPSTLMSFMGRTDPGKAASYASIIYPVRDMADNLRRSGRAIQGVRPGRPTAEFLEKTLNRLIFIGAVAVGIIAILPIHVEQLTYVQTLQGLGSTSLIILVGVAIDTRRQIVTHALSARYQARGLFRAPGQKEF
jgi:preprotein translocase subunit SecY